MLCCPCLRGPEAASCDGVVTDEKTAHSSIEQEAAAPRFTRTVNMQLQFRVLPPHAMRHAFILANVPLKKYTGRDNPANTFQLRLANVAVQEQAITSSFANKAYAKVMTRHNAL